MRIGFDGKRAYENKTGLGNYIRSLVAILTNQVPKNEYNLFAPKKTRLFNDLDFKNTKSYFPLTFLGKSFPAFWRSRLMVNEIVKEKIELFHGVSNELPRGIEKTNVKTVVTVHDLIFERFPETYPFDQRYVHRWKIKHACKIADAVIAISNQTKADLIQYYHVPEEKITVCYQSCNPIFQCVISENEKTIVKKRYHLPDQYFLFVSSIAPRKNLISVCEAMIKIKNQNNIPLVVIGNGKKDKEDVKQLMAKNGLRDKLILLNELPASKDSNFTTAKDFPAIYQQALALIYPSIFEGFGAPLLEALYSGIPVISSNASCLPEVGGDAAIYFDPYDINAIADHLIRISTDPQLRKVMIEKGLDQAKKFTQEQYAKDILNVYNKIL